MVPSSRVCSITKPNGRRPCLLIRQRSVGCYRNLISMCNAESQGLSPAEAYVARLVQACLQLMTGPARGAATSTGPADPPATSATQPSPAPWTPTGKVMEGASRSASPGAEVAKAAAAAAATTVLPLLSCFICTACGRELCPPAALVAAWRHRPGGCRSLMRQSWKPPGGGEKRTTSQSSAFLPHACCAGSKLCSASLCIMKRSQQRPAHTRQNGF